MPGSRLATRETLYLALLLVGTAVPLAHFAPWLVAHGVDVPLLLQQLFANPISSFFGWDVILAVITLLILASIDNELSARRRAVVAAAALLGASVGLPMYLWLRERQLRRHGGPCPTTDGT